MGIQQCVWECACNPTMQYKTRNSLTCHRRSHRHQAWLARQRLLCPTKQVSLSSPLSKAQKLEQRILELEAVVQDLLAHPRKRRVSEAMKKKVAFAQAWTCKQCAQILPPCYEIDHCVPLWRGGTNEEANLVALCRNCHGSKTQNDIILKGGGC